MVYFSNGRDRSEFRRIAVGRKEWYDSKVLSYAQLGLSGSLEYDEAQYFEYVSDQRNLGLYIESLDADDRAEGSVVVGGGRVLVDVGGISDEKLGLACMLYHSGFAMLPDDDRKRIEEEAREWYMVYCQLLG